MDNVALLGRAIDEVTRLTDAMTDEQLSNPTPCSEWSVRDLLNHLVGGSTMFAICCEDGSVPDDVMGGLMSDDQLGDDFRGAWKAASARAMAGFSRPGIMEQEVTLPFGTMPAGVAAAIAVFDVTTHGCDLATATGQSVADGELLDVALAAGRQMIGPEMRASGLFPAEQPAPDGASSTQRLLAFAGRAV